MDIAAMSMSLSSSKLQMQAGLAVTKKAMDVQEVVAGNMIDMLEQAAPPQSEHIIDVKA